MKKFKVLPFLHEKKREPYDSRFQLVLLEFLIKELLQLQQSVPTNKLLFRVNLCDLTQLRKGPPDLFCQNKKQRSLRNAAFILDTRVGATANAFVLLKFSIKELLQLQQHMLRLRQP